MPTEKWRNAIYSQWTFVGLAIFCLLLIPETPRFYAQKGKHDQAKLIMKKIYKGIPNFDLDHEYSIVLKEIEDGKLLLDKQKDVTILDCFRGTNLVGSFYISTLLFQQLLTSCF